MKRPLIVTAVVATVAFAGPFAPASAGPAAATVTHYTASYPCPCFGAFDLTGVHVTNVRFPGLDAGPYAAATTGGRDNFSGTVTEPPATEMVFNDANSGEWCSDYVQVRALCTTEWSETVEPDGSVTGWAIYPDGA